MAIQQKSLEHLLMLQRTSVPMKVYPNPGLPKRIEVLQHTYAVIPDRPKVVREVV